MDNTDIDTHINAEVDSVLHHFITSPIMRKALLEALADLLQRRLDALFEQGRAER